MTTKSPAGVVIPQFQATAAKDIPGICEKVREAFRTNKTKKLEWRKIQLRKLYWALEDYTPQLLQALKQDLNKGTYESMLTEISWCKNDCMFMLSNLDDFAKDEYPGRPHVPVAFAMGKIRIHKEPLGAVLVIGAYNYPLQLALSPFIGAIAAGCTAVVKPSENAPAVAMVMEEMIRKRLDWTAFAVVNGAVPETTALLDQRWAKICYTGSTQVGRIIARKAAETLTPVTLELGGRNPAFVTRNADVKLAAKRLLWPKVMAAGQVCLSQNYILVERAVLDSFIAELNLAHKSFFPDGAKDSEMAKVINERQWLRIKKMLDETKGKIVMGGQVDQAALFIEPTAVLVDSVDDSMMVEESFGPIFAIMAFDKLPEAIRIANQVDPTPLALYVFGSDAENNKVLNEVTSGGATFNDSFGHAQLNTVPFGGVGTSGTGAYRGKASFDTFSHHRTVAQTPYWMEKLLRARYMPYRMSELKMLALISGQKPDFDRNGKVVKGVAYWAGLIFGLGGKDAQGAFMRWMAVLLAAYLSGMYGSGRLIWTNNDLLQKLPIPSGLLRR